MMKLFYILSIFIVATLGLKAEIQKTPKFGNITNEEMELSACPIDSSTQGYYLFDKGSTDFVYRQTVVRSDDTGSQKGFQMVFKRHLRLKILDKAATDNGDFEISLYKSGNNEERLANIKGFTYNLDGGKVSKTKLDTKQIIYEKKADHLTIVKIPMPDIREGSVIDLEYEILSDFLFNLQEWYFQRQLPVMYSEYRVSIPEYFFYKPATFGYLGIGQKTTNQPRSIKLTYIQQAEGMTTQEGRYEHEEKYQEKVTTYYVSEVPAFKPERYLRAQKNYLSRIAFELEGTRFPDSGYKSFSTSWKEVADELLTSDNFGKTLNRGGFLDAEARQLNSSYTDNTEKVAAAFSLVQGKLRWNGQERLFAGNNLKKTWDDGIGNSADINLCLIALLKNMGLSAYPVVLSTQSNGILPLTHPSITDLNYVIAMVEVDNNTILMDATSPYSHLNLLPERCLNGKGQIVDASRYGDIDIKATASHQTNIRVSLKMLDDGSFEGEVELKENGYAGMDRRSQYYKENDSLLFVRQLEKEFPGLRISNHRIYNIENPDAELIDSIDVAIEDWTDVMGDMMVFSPLLTFKISDNPFKLEDRDYPVEFSYPRRHRVLCQIEIPEGYAIESMPTPIRVAMPDRDMELIYNVSSDKNIIQVVSDFKINKLLFLPAEYESVKETFSYLINKHNEKVVLKRL